MMLQAAILPNTNMVAKKKMGRATHAEKITKDRKLKDTNVAPCLLSPTQNERNAEFNTVTLSESDFKKGQEITVLKGRVQLSTIVI